MSGDGYTLFTRNQLIESAALEVFVRFSRKVDHCLFVEEESYNWAPDRSQVSKRMLFFMTFLLLGAVVALTQMR